MQRLLAVPVCVLVALFFTLAGCSSDTSTTDSNSSSTSFDTNLNVELKDAASDELDRFEVDITSVALVRPDGMRVETLPLTTRVDFTDLIEVAELLVAASVPHGAYSSMSMTVDFGAASVHIAGEDSDAAVLDENGLPMTGTLTLAVDFEQGQKLIIAPGLPRILTIDFDLDASVAVDAAANSVKVSPFLIAGIDLALAHSHRVRGELDEVNVERHRFVLDLLPFRHHLHHFGRVHAGTDENTSFEIDGEPFTGDAGLARLAELPESAPVVAIGHFRLPGGLFHADHVIAGTSVHGGNLDRVEGIVTARSGNTLLVEGANIEPAQGPTAQDAQIIVKLKDTITVVRRQFGDETLSVDAVSVGQRISAAGVLSGEPGTFQLGSVEQVRLLPTLLSGEVVSVNPGLLVVDVERFGAHSASDFDFTGTGVDCEYAVAIGYRIDTGSMELGEVEAGEPVRIFGFVNAFGAAPPDFEAQTVAIHE